MLTATATEKMTAREMANRLDWAEVTVHFGHGHITSQGRVKVIIGSEVRVCVWVGDLCLHASTVVVVEDDNVVRVHVHDQGANQ